MIKNRQGVIVTLLTLVALIASTTLSITGKVNISYIVIMIITVSMFSIYSMGIYKHNEKVFTNMVKVDATVDSFKEGMCILLNKCEVSYNISGKDKSTSILTDKKHEAGETVVVVGFGSLEDGVIGEARFKVPFDE